MELLILTAVAAERDAVLAGISGSAHDVRAVGVGPAAAAAGAARLIAESHRRYDGVINAGVCGAVGHRADIGDTVVATASVAAELGVALPDRVQPIDELGFGTNRMTASPHLTAGIAGLRGEVLTLSSITGSTSLGAVLADRHPEAIAEAMEGFGVATAARQAGLPYAEVRTVSNHVGDRDVANWEWQTAFDALSKAVGAL